MGVTETKFGLEGRAVIFFPVLTNLTADLLHEAEASCICNDVVESIRLCKGEIRK